MFGVRVAEGGQGGPRIDPSGLYRMAPTGDDPRDRGGVASLSALASDPGPRRDPTTRGPAMRSSGEEPSDGLIAHVASAVHELKTPIAVIIGFAEHLQHQWDESDREQL